jgi:hypothetical protein
MLTFFQLDFYSDWLSGKIPNYALAKIEILYLNNLLLSSSSRVGLLNVNNNRTTLYSGQVYEFRCTIVYFLFLPGLEISFVYTNGSEETLQSNTCIEQYQNKFYYTRIRSLKFQNSFQIQFYTV